MLQLRKSKTQTKFRVYLQVPFSVNIIYSLILPIIPYSWINRFSAKVPSRSKLTDYNEEFVDIPILFNKLITKI